MTGSKAAKKTGPASYELKAPVRRDWAKDALCAKLAGWFDAGVQDQIRACRNCPVIAECRRAAVDEYSGRFKAAKEDRVTVGGWTRRELVAAVREASRV